MGIDTGDEKIIVTIDLDLEDLIPGYMENRRKDIRTVHKALGDGEFEPIRILGHSMKGSGGGYGFDAVSDIGKAIEDAANAKNTEIIKAQLVILTDYLDRVEVVYEEE